MHDIYQKRKRAFIDRRGWDIRTYDGGDFEVDQFDDPTTIYITTWHDEVSGCVRLRPYNSPNLTACCFSWLINGSSCGEKVISLDHEADFWEASRFFVSPNFDFLGGGRSDIRMHVLLLAMLKFAIQGRVSKYAVIVDDLMMRLLRMSGWNPMLLNSGAGSNAERIHYCHLPCNTSSYLSVLRRAQGSFSFPSRAVNSIGNPFPSSC
ncbi:acyl-homoserine-lactone synthase [Halomonas salifodinae]|uniref:Acyl-homoserine-lactone synthase n=1 Tax=Halomonas salifodinae TaxID=438745 RepID=A0ABW2EQN0_9GAMM